MNVITVPMFKDNYAYVVVNPETAEAVVIDPAEPAPVLAALQKVGATLKAVLCTHHHYDHTGGNETLVDQLPGLEVIGSEGDAVRIPALTRSVKAGSEEQVIGLSYQVIDVSCHTGGHVAFLFGDNLFSGDALFVGGCGRFFEGDAQDMHNALITNLADLPDHTNVYCGHEYTLSNLRYALAVEPNNIALQDKMAWAKVERAAGRPTVPSTLGGERAYNPFMRVSAPDVKAFTGEEDPVEVMRVLREKKNQF